MIERIIRYSVTHKLVVGLGVLVLIALGARAITRLPVDAVPDITNNQVQVITIAPTLATLEVEQFVSYPIEQALGNLPEVHELRSISRFGVSQVTIVFDDAFDTYLARQLVNERLQLVRADLPPGVEQPYLAPLSTGLGEVFQYVIHPKPGYEGRYNAMELREVQDWIVARQLMGIAGVAEINSFGGYLKQFEVAVDPARLHGMGLGIGDLLAALERNNGNTGGAYIERSSNAYYIRGVGLAKGIADVERIVVETPEHGAPVLVRDVATVRLGHAPRYGAMTRNGEGEVVGGIVMMLKGENANKVVARVKERLARIEKNLPEGLTIDPFLDRTALVDRAIGTVEKNLLEGALIVILVLVLFLGQLRAGLIVASVIPLAMLFALILMDLTGETGNLMSLGAIDFGLIVDGAVIIVEAVLHRLHHGRAHAELSRTEMDDEVGTAAGRMMNAATFGQLIILIVYVPILSLSGIEGKMFGPMARTVAFAILGAILLSLTYVPMMSALFIKRRTGQDKPNFSDRMMAAVEGAYRPLLERVLRHRMAVVVSALALLGVSVFGFLRMGGEFIPQLEEGDFAFHSILPQGSALSASVTNNQLVERKLMQFPEVKMVVGKTGTAEVPTDLMSPEQTDMMIMLKEKEEWTTTEDYWTLADTMFKALQTIPGVFFEINQPIQMRFNELMTGVRQDIAVKVYGPDLDSLRAIGDRISALIAGVPGAGPPQPERVSGLPQITISYDRERMAALGCDVDEVNRTVRAAFAGEAAGSIYENERRFDLVVRADTSVRKDIADVARLFVRSRNGNLLPLDQVADVRYADAPAQITHENAQRRIYVGVNTRGRDVESLVAEIQQRVDRDLKLPPGYYLTFGGQFQNLVEAKARLAIALPLALLLILGLLYFTFRSLPNALLIFTAVPLSAIGGVAALYLRGMPFSISAGVGFIALFGVAVLNGMVLINTFQQLAKEGVDDVVERVRKGTVLRLRPVLMTASVASLGFLPMALSGSAGAEVQRPLATVVIGGLVTATLLTLVVLPVLYVMVWSRLKRPTVPVKVVALLMALGGGAQLHAQELPRFTLEDALDTAHALNPGLLKARKLTEASDELRRTGSELPATSVMYMQGQYNGYATDDNNITIQQTIPFPTRMAARSGLKKAEAEAQQMREAVATADLDMALKQSYHRLGYMQARDRLLREQDSLFTGLLRVEELRFATGEAAQLARISAEVRSLEAREQWERNRADLRTEQARFGMLLGLDGPADRAPAPFTAIVPLSLDTAVTAPDVVLLQREVQVAEQVHRTARQELLPDITLGYFNQTLIGAPMGPGSEVLATRADRFTGFMAGISLPLWFVPHTARAKAGSLQEEAAQLAAEEGFRQFRSALEQALAQYRKDRATLDRYEASVLPQAERILQATQKAYAAGEIGQAEHVLNLQQVNAIRRDHLDTVNSLNGTVLLIERLSASGRTNP
jgi:cobalt-zinc-cadmium resistance protein CzcA